MNESKKKLIEFLEYYRMIWGDEIYPQAENGDIIDTATDINRGLAQKQANNSIKPSEISGDEKSELEKFYEDIKECTKCNLGLSRTNFVFGTGNPTADLLLIGEAPGREEDIQGEPFVGRAGKLLNRILESIDFRREEVYIGNILKCRPPKNRDPLPEEIEKCEPYLKKQIEIIGPIIILTLGRVAAQTLLKTKASLKDLRQKIHFYQNIRTIVTYHPAALLRNPQNKRPTWEDMKFLRRIYDELKD